MHTLLLISNANENFYLSIAGAILAIGLSFIAWAIRTAECYEHEDDPVYSPDDMKPVSYSEIVSNERQYPEQIMYT